MAGLADIAPLTQTVKIRGNDIEVSGVNVLDMAKLGFRFPEIADLVYALQQGGLNAAILNLPRNAFAALLAAGCGQHGDADAERGAANLKADEQLELLAAILPLSMKDGVAPFLLGVDSLIKAIEKVSGIKAQIKQEPTTVTNLRPLPQGAVRIRSMKPLQQASSS